MAKKTKPVKMKPAKGKTWRQKLTDEKANQGKIVDVPPSMQERLGAGTLLIPKPLDVDEMMRGVKSGKLITHSQIRAELARRAGANSTCPLCTGIFVKIVAETAEEDLREGKKRVTPYWRTIKDDGSLNDKFPGGVEAQAKRLRKEGFEIQNKRGKKLRVTDFEKHLARI